MGDLNNVLFSWVEAANIFDFDLYIAHPKQIRPSKELKKISYGKKILLLHKMLSRLYIIVIVLLLTLGFLWEAKKVLLVSNILKDIK